MKYQNRKVESAADNRKRIANEAHATAKTPLPKKSLKQKVSEWLD